MFCFFVFFFWSEGFSMLYDMWNQVPSQRHVTAGGSNRWSFTELRLSEGKRVGLNSLKSIHFLPSGIFTAQTRQRENKVALPHIFFSSNGVKMKDRDEIRERKRTHGGLLSCSHV